MCNCNKQPTTVTADQAAQAAAGAADRVTAAPAPAASMQFESEADFDAYLATIPYVEDQLVSR